MTFEIEIIETLSTVKEVEATSLEDAIQYVKALHRSGEIILGADNSNIETEFREL